MHPDYERMYGFTNCLINANFINKKMEKVIPPTDSRRRPDMRAYENGDVKLASSEKTRIEEK